MCDICGVAYLRSRLVRRNGLLYCSDPGCSKGMDRVEIAEALKATSMGRRWPQNVRDGGNWDHSDDPPPNDNRAPANPGKNPSGGTPGEGIEDVT